MKSLKYLFLISIVFLSCSDDDDDNITPPSETTFTDSRDVQTYDIITIGNQTWFAQNLNYDTEEASDCYDNDQTNCFIYGKLYEGDIA